MFICNECGEVFEEPRRWEEHHPYGMTYATEYWSECPRCGGGYEEARQCTICGEYVAQTMDGMCDECYEEINEEGEGV